MEMVMPSIAIAEGFMGREIGGAGSSPRRASRTALHDRTQRWRGRDVPVRPAVSYKYFHEAPRIFRSADGSIIR